MKKQLFKGCSTALITPFKKDLSIDYEALKNLIERQIENGITSLTILGTTSEYATLKTDELDVLLEFIMKTINKRAFVICGVGSNNTLTALENAERAEKYGVDALLIVTPYYNKTSQKGLIEHFKFLADNLKTPIILYNVPTRTGMTFTSFTYNELSNHPNIYGTKDASSDFGLLLKTKSLCPDDFYIYSGNDDQIIPILSLGGSGVISVLSNIIPREVSKMCSLFFEKKFEEALEIQVKYCDLIEGLFSDVSPMPTKYILSKMGLIENVLRLPLISIENDEKLDNLIQKHKMKEFI